MIDINELRRLAQAATAGPWKILQVGDGRQKFAVADRKSLSILTVTDEGEATFGTVYDDADAKFIAAANPATINDLLNRLEEAEQTVQDYMRIDREKSQIAQRLEAAEKERDDVAQQLVQSEIGKREISEAHNAVTGRLSVLADENTAMRAKVKAMEQQEPVATVIKEGDSRYWMSERLWTFPDGKYPLYTLPDAQPAPSVPLEAIDKMLTQLMDIAISNGANSISMPDEYVEVAAWLCGIPAQPAPSVPDGWKLVPIEPTPMMKTAGIGVEVYQDSPPSSDCLTWEEVEAIYTAMLAATPEAKP